MDDAESLRSRLEELQQELEAKTARIQQLEKEKATLQKHNATLSRKAEKLTREQMSLHVEIGFYKREIMDKTLAMAEVEARSQVNRMEAEESKQRVFCLESELEQTKQDMEERLQAVKQKSAKFITHLLPKPGSGFDAENDQSGPAGLIADDEQGMQEKVLAILSAFCNDELSEDAAFEQLSQFNNLLLTANPSITPALPAATEDSTTAGLAAPSIHAQAEELAEGLTGLQLGVATNSDQTDPIATTAAATAVPSLPAPELMSQTTVQNSDTDATAQDSNTASPSDMASPSTLRSETSSARSLNLTGLYSTDSTQQPAEETTAPSAPVVPPAFLADRNTAGLLNSRSFSGGSFLTSFVLAEPDKLQRLIDRVNSARRAGRLGTAPSLTSLPSHNSSGPSLTNLTSNNSSGRSSMDVMPSLGGNLDQPSMGSNLLFSAANSAATRFLGSLPSLPSFSSSSTAAPTSQPAPATAPSATTSTTHTANAAAASKATPNFSSPPRPAMSKPVAKPAARFTLEAGPAFQVGAGTPPRSASAARASDVSKGGTGATGKALRGGRIQSDVFRQSDDFGDDFGLSQQLTTSVRKV